MGTGRCGTKSLAADLGGLHEPEPWFGADATAAYWGDEQAIKLCRARLEYRLELGAPAIVDLHHSYIMPLICDVDPDASFVWAIRQPVACIGSFLAGNAWSGDPGNWPTLWQPRRGWWGGTTRLQKATTYWCAVNTIIWHELAKGERPWHALPTEALKAHENKRMDVPEWRFSDVDRYRITDRCGPLWWRLCQEVLMEAEEAS